MQGLEYALWEAQIGQRNEYGRLRMTDHHRARLHHLSQGCQGRIIYDDVMEETWIPREDWEKRVVEWCAGKGTRL